MTPAEQLNPVYWTPERIERIRRTSPRTFRMHVQNLFGGGESVFDYDAVERATRPFPYDSNDGIGQWTIICDPSSGKKDTWAWCRVAWITPFIPFEAYKYRPLLTYAGSSWCYEDENHVTHLGMPPLRDDYVAPVRPYLAVRDINGIGGEIWGRISADDIIGRVANMAHWCGARVVHSDQRESYMLQAAFRRHSLQFSEHPYTAQNKEAAVERVRRWLREGLLSLPDHPALRQELHAFVAKPTAGGGWTFGARGSGHDDYVALLLTAALADMNGEIQGSPIHVPTYRTERKWDNRI